MNFNKETIKKNVTGYLNNLDNDRKTFPEETIINSLPSFVYKGLFYLIGIMVVFLLLMDNILEHDIMVQLQGSLGFIIFFLGFIYLMLKLIDATMVKRYQRDLGVFKDMLRVFVYITIIFVLSTFTLVSLGTYTMTDPELGEYESHILKSMDNLMTVLTWAINFAIVSISIRIIILVILLFKDTNSGKRTRIKKDVSIKLLR